MIESMPRRKTQFVESNNHPKGDGLDANVVFVIDGKGAPLLPTTHARARILLKKGKAEVATVVPFTVRLKRTVKKPAGSFMVGIDDGAKTVGIAVASPSSQVVFAANVELRQDVSRKITQRALYRRNRRSRNLRHRQARFLNRGKKGFLPPSIRYRKDATLRVLADLGKRLNITHAVVEQGQFDTASMSAGYKLVGKEYSYSAYTGNTFRQKVLWRDQYSCQNCSGENSLQAHHMAPKSRGGTNCVSNGITLCKACHTDLHAGKWQLDKRPRQFRYPSQTQQGKYYLFGRLKELYGDVRVCYGWMTAKARKRLGLSKDHHSDAAAMLDASDYNTVVYSVKPKRTKVWKDNPTKKCTEKNGFRHYDVVKSSHRRLGSVVGSVSSLKKTCMTLRSTSDSSLAVSYKKSRLLYRPQGLIYTF